jgi:SAM-dependent MidA family methyltransferase
LRFPDPGLPPPSAEALAHSQALAGHIADEIDAAGGWIDFVRYMERALYEPGLGYYARGAQLFGPMPASGSDFVTAPELSPLFGAALARQARQVLEATAASEIFEFGAGSGVLAEQLIETLAGEGFELRRYHIVDLSGALRARQAERLARFGERVCWHDAWPERIEGFVVGNEVLDAMPVQLLHRAAGGWCERGVVVEGTSFGWGERASALCPPGEAAFPEGSTVELHTHALAFVRTLAERLARGAALFIDYGFPEAEYYHPQRHMGTLMCHRAHRADSDPLQDIGEKDITAHVDFTGIALAAQGERPEAGLEVLGYTSQARFLMNCGLLDRLHALEAADWRARAAAQKLLGEHEMGELFKAIMLGRGLEPDLAPIGFAAGDRTHTL